MVECSSCQKKKKRGRPEKNLPTDIRNTIIQFRNCGWSIRKITENLNKKDVKLSRYQVWKVVREYEKEKCLKELKRQIDIEKKEVYCLGVLNLKNDHLLILVHLNVCEVIVSEHMSDASLATILDAVEPHLREIIKKSKRKVLVVLPHVRPLSLGRGGHNKLTKKIKNMGAEYIFVDWNRRRRKFREKVKSTFETQGDEEGIKIIKQGCRTIVKELKEVSE